jgi:exopolysaccharide biosynthesis polyprenyl glycosylphosphotransferase
MSNSHRKDFLIPALAVALDAVATEAAFLFSYWFRFKTSVFSFLPLHEDIPPLPAYFYGSLFVMLVWVLLFQTRGMYGARRNVSLGSEFSAVVRLVTFGMLIVMSAAFYYRAFSYSRLVFGLLWLTSIVLIFAGRAIVRVVERRLYASGRNLRNALIIGTNEAANRIYERFNNHPLLGYKLVGYLGDRPAAGNIALSRMNYFGTMDNVLLVMEEHSVELALIALDHNEHDKLYKLMQECEGLNCEFLVVPDILHVISGGLRVKELEGMPFIRVKSMPMSTWGRILKRTFDILVSFLLLLILSPFFLLIEIIIKLDSKGSVFYKQERVGVDGLRFAMLKFRSMNVGAEKETGPVWAAEKDPRRTKFGAFLRKTSIDELPQLLNVLRGEMSLVGPRPERPFFVEQFKGDVPQYLERHRMKTGMTGWAQVNGLRGNTSLEERVKYDVYYIENWSVRFDIRILFLTFRALVSTKNIH